MEKFLVDHFLNFECDPIGTVLLIHSLFSTKFPASFGPQKNVIFVYFGRSKYGYR